MKVRILAAVALIAVIAGLLWLTAGFKADYEAAMEQYHQEVRLLSEHEMGCEKMLCMQSL